MRTIIAVLIALIALVLLPETIAAQGHATVRSSVTIVESYDGGQAAAEFRSFAGGSAVLGWSSVGDQRSANNVEVIYSIRYGIEGDAPFDGRLERSEIRYDTSTSTSRIPVGGSELEGSTVRVQRVVAIDA